MKLITKAIRERFQKIGLQEDKGDDAIVITKFFCPWNKWTWYVTEYDPDEEICFGLVRGQETELGYFSLEEMKSIKGPFGMKIERDLHWKEATISEVRESLMAHGCA